MTNTEIVWPRKVQIHLEKDDTAPCERRLLADLLKAMTSQVEDTDQTFERL